MLERPLYLQPDLDAQLAALAYSERDAALVREFAERGYVVVQPEFDDFERLAAEIVRTTEPRYAMEDGGRVTDGYWHLPAVRELASNASVIETLKLLHGRNAFPMKTLNFNVGTEQPVHSDTIHFESFPPGFMAGVWVALEDVDGDNGPLVYYPGSHRLPHLTLADFGVRGDAPGGHRRYVDVYEPAMQRHIEALGLKPEFGHLRKGEALIWSANLLHGGSPIKDRSRTRHSQVTHYYFERCVWHSPMQSDPAMGAIARSHPRDIRTLKMVDGEYLGTRVRPPLARRLIERLRGR